MVKSFFKQPRQPRGKKAAIPESALQQYADDAIVVRGLTCLRIPDGFWRRVRMMGVIDRAMCSRLFAGKPDNTVSATIDGRYMLTMQMEIKTEDSKHRPVGDLHGKQVINSRFTPWVIVRNPQEIDQALDGLVSAVSRIRGALNERHGA